MAQDQARPGSRLHPLLVTLLALAAFRLASQLPLYGIDARALAELLRGGGLGVERLSLGGLGITPLFSALLIVEFFRLTAPWFARWTAANPLTLVRYARALALAFAAFQAMGIAGALEQAPRVVPEPGLVFRIATVVGLVGGVGLALWLADEITRRGVGSGFWLLLCVPMLAGLPRSFATGAELQRLGMMGPAAWAVAAIFLPLAAAAVVKLDGARPSGEPGVQIAGLWPPILGYTTLGWLTGLLYALMPSGTGDPNALWYGPGQPFYLGLLAALTILFSMLRLARMQETAAWPLARIIRLGAIAGGMQAAILVAGEIAQQMSPVALNGMWLIIIVTVMLRIRDGIGAPEHSPGSPDGAAGGMIAR